MILLLSKNASAPTRIMPLGDSITHGVGSVDTDGYRKRLDTALDTAGYEVSFVGSLSSGTFLNNDHEGHDGFTISQIQASVGGWITASQPTIILLQIGTNDVVSAIDLPNAPTRLGTLLDTIHGAGPRIDVLVTPITLVAPPLDTTLVDDYNEGLRTVVAAKQAAGYRVRLADATGTLEVNDLQTVADFVHPNDTGYLKIAAAWFTILTTLPSVDSNELRQPDTYAEMITGDLFAPIAESWLGIPGKGVPLRQTGVVDDNLYAGHFQNTGAGGLSFLAVSGDSSKAARLTDSGFTVDGGMLLDTLVITGNMTVAGAFVASTIASAGNTTVGGNLVVFGGTTVAGALVASTLSVNGQATIGSVLVGLSGGTFAGSLVASTLFSGGGATIGTTLQVVGAASIGSTLAVASHVTIGGSLIATGSSTFRAGISVTGPTVLIGDITLNNSIGETLLSGLTTSGAQILAIGPTTTPGLYVDVAQNKTFIGRNTPLPSASDDRFSVIGGSQHIAPNSSQSALYLRYVPTATAGVSLGASAAATPNLCVSGGGLVVFTGGTNIMAGGATITGGATLTSGGLTATNGASLLMSLTVVTGGISVTGSAFLGTTTFSNSVTFSTGGITVTGSSVFSSGISVTTGGLTVTAGGLTVSAGGATVGSGLTVSAGNLTMSGANAQILPATAPSTPVATALYKNNLCAGWARFDGTATGTNAPAGGYNCSTIQRTATGTYTFTFATGLPTADYILFGCAQGTKQTISEAGSAPSSSAFNFSVYDDTGALVDRPRVYVGVIGGT